MLRITDHKPSVSALLLYSAIFGFIFPKVHGQDDLFNESVIWPEFKDSWTILLPPRIYYAVFQNICPMFESDTFRNGTTWIPHTHAPGAPNPGYLSHGLWAFLVWVRMDSLWSAWVCRCLMAT